MAAVPDKSSGDNLAPSELFKLFGVDTTGGSTTSTSYVKIGEVAVPAGKVGTYVEVTAMVTGASVDAGSATEAGTWDVRIGETGSEVSKDTFTAGGFGADGGGSFTINYTITYYYTPTSDEKTNGFNVQIYAKTADAGSPAMVVHQLLVKGV